MGDERRAVHPDRLGTPRRLLSRGPSRAERFRRLRERVGQAFALSVEGDGLPEDDLAALDRLARLVADRGLAAPAIFFVESLAPLGFLGGQLLHALTPILEAVASPAEIERLGRLLERRDTPALLAERLYALDAGRDAPNEARG
jgi:hypothetical protein